MKLYLENLQNFFLNSSIYFKRNMINLMFIISIIYFGNFAYARLFGIYDDDFIFVAPPYIWNIQDLWIHVKVAITTWPQGRPIAFSLTHIISYLCSRTDSFGLSYLVGYFLVAINGLLVYALAKRFLPISAAILAACVYGLYPADGSRAILVYRVFVVLNITFLLVSLLAYLNKKYIVAYIISILCFLTYEMVYMVFLIAPFLTDSPRTVRLKKVGAHFSLCGLTVAILLMIRKLFGDPRIHETFGDPLITIKRIIMAIWYGPITVLRALFERPFEAIFHTDFIIWVPVIICASAYIIISKKNTNKKEGASAMWIAAVGLFGLICGYIICFRDDYWPPIMNIGRISGYHAAGSVGASLLVAGIYTQALNICNKKKTTIITITGIYIAFLFSYSMEVQRVDYVAHAQQQKQFWSRILDTSSMWKKNTVVLVDISEGDQGAISTPGMPAWWVVNFAPIFLDKIIKKYKTESSLDCDITPRVYGYHKNFKSIIDCDGAIIKTPEWLGPDAWPKITNHNFIYFKFINGKIIQSDDSLEIAGKSFFPISKNDSNKSEEYIKLPLYKALWDQQSNWPSIIKSKNYPR